MDLRNIPHAWNELIGRECQICREKAQLLTCGGCKVVFYCGTAHQTADRSNHKKACNAIKKSRGHLEREEAALRSADTFNSGNVFNVGRGKFWGIFETRDYMRARHAAATNLLGIHTELAVQCALDHFIDMLHLSHNDNMGVRDIVPDLFLRLGQEQKCYDFIKWWATHHDYDLPHDRRMANPFEGIDAVCNKDTNLSLGHLVSLTLLKLRMHLDVEQYNQSDYEPGSMIYRPIGKLVLHKMKQLSAGEIYCLADLLDNQYRLLCRQVHNQNPQFWDLLIDESDEPLNMPQYYSVGSTEEAIMTVIQCKRAWEESEDTIRAIACVTIDLPSQPVHTRTSATPASGNMSQSSPAVPTATEPSGIEKRIGTGKAFPAKFRNLLQKSPAELFPVRSASTASFSRYVHIQNQEQVLVYTDGACSNNGQPEKNAQGGWAVVYGPCHDTTSLTVSGRLETAGPTGAKYVATSNRAELRAVIAALRLADWRAEGFTSIVIATDSAYVTDGATNWAKSWVQNSWRNSSGEPVMNRDLWELLLGEVEILDEKGLRVEIWKIPRDLNAEADAAAKKASNLTISEPHFRDNVIPTMAKSDSTDTVRVLVICVEEKSMFESVHSDLIHSISTVSQMQVAGTEKAALTLLAADQQQAKPSVILIADGAITRRKKLRDAVIERLNAGATVVLAGCFSSLINAEDIKRFMSAAGLPWERGVYERTTTVLRANLRGQAQSSLRTSYSQKALHLKNVDTDSVWYAHEYTRGQVAVAFAKLAGGKGRLGYVGDCNGEDATIIVVLAMCGLID
ncbi:hypothetical protein N7495_008394 [Penicillium taxi]|uniref:uncharacterized protein n=1 Tax=Penicillium taxi TaxID=168475 RepID=UPI002544D9CF|nr:uncharacterized protein N7495_008394 [Penicillium taxi]KAJ5888353.1 hypothetical protein N7495_008394 [Penicillium taxi]